MSRYSRFPRKIHGKQSGFLIPLSLFIVVGMAALALVIHRFSSVGTSTVVYETLSVQAFYAAESAVEVALNQILFDTSSRTDADNNCVAVNGSSVVFSAASLVSCQADLSCERFINGAESTRVYRIQSSAQCGSGQFVATRRIEAGAAF